MRVARASDLGAVLDRFQQADRIAATHRLTAGSRDQTAERVGCGRAVERDRAARLGERGQLWHQCIRFLDIGRLFEMVAGQVRELAMIDEDRRPAALWHQRVGER